MIWATTNFLHPKYDLLYRYRFLINFEDYLKKLSENDIISLNRALAYEMLTSIKLDTAFTEFLKLEIDSPQIPTLTYLDIYRSLIIPSEQIKTSIHVDDIKESKYPFAQPKTLAHFHRNDISSFFITQKDLIQRINFVFLNTDFHLNESSYTLGLETGLYTYFHNSSWDQRKDFLQFLAKEMKNTIDLGPKLSKFLETEIIHPTLDFSDYLNLYKDIMLHYHSKSHIEGHLEAPQKKSIFIMKLYSSDFDSIHSLLKKEVSEDNLMLLSKMLAYIFLHTRILDNSNPVDRDTFNFLLKRELLNYLASLDAELESKFYTFFISSLLKDPIFSENMSDYLRSLYSHSYSEMRYFLSSRVLNFIQTIIRNFEHEIRTGDDASIPLGKYFSEK